MNSGSSEEYDIIAYVQTSLVFGLNSSFWQVRELCVLTGLAGLAEFETFFITALCSTTLVLAATGIRVGVLHCLGLTPSDVAAPDAPDFFTGTGILQPELI